MAATPHRMAYAVWEITLKCNLACRHCGSRAGEPRPAELTTDEALDLVRQLAEVGVNEVTLIGGEAFLRPDWLQLAEAITRAGMLCTMTTGGYGIAAQTARRMKDAGIALVSVSVDGLEETHDFLRGRPGSWRWCFKTLENIRATGVPVTCNTQINRLSAPELPRLYEVLRDAGIVVWYTSLTVPMGNAADNAEILFQPGELRDLFPMLARIAGRARREGVHFIPGPNVGYYGPLERSLRGDGHPWEFYQGPPSGLSLLGIEADGSIKADPALPSAAYIGGNIREQPLRTILEEAPQLRFNLGAGTPAGSAHLWGFCKSCEFAALCRGGDPWTAHVFLGRRGNNPYCHHRALVQEAHGRRERVALDTPAEGKPFDHGRFTLYEEPIDTPWPAADGLHFTAGRVEWPADWPAEAEEAALPPREQDPVFIEDIRPAAINEQDSDTRAGILPILPRRAWSSEIDFLRALFRAKKALDVAEREAERCRIGLKTAAI